jgi:hypothetical protein
MEVNDQSYVSAALTRGKISRYLLSRNQRGLQSWSGRLEHDRNLLSHQESKHDSSVIHTVP